MRTTNNPFTFLRAALAWLLLALSLPALAQPLPSADPDDGVSFRVIAFHDVRANVRASFETSPEATAVDERTFAETLAWLQYNGHHPVSLQQIVDACPMGSKIFAAGGWYTADSLNVTAATKKLLMIQFGGAPGGDDWYRTLDAIVAGDLDPSPSIGMRVDLDGVPDAIDLARKAEGPPRIIVHPNQ